MLDFCIIGSGISGSTIANCLNKKYKLLLYDKAKGAGGRSSFKRYKGNIGFDHGLQYLSPRSKEFKSFTNILKREPEHLRATYQHLLAQWTHRCVIYYQPGVNTLKKD